MDRTRGHSTLLAHALMGVMGTLTSIIVVCGNAYIAQHFGINLLSISFFFVLPAGALLGGLCAASGYFLGAKWTHTQPGRWLQVSMIAIAAMAWWFARWLDYQAYAQQADTRIFGVREHHTFWEFLKHDSQHTELTFSLDGQPFAAGEPGKLGHLREALQLAGFAAGGLLCFALLANEKTCTRCRKYATAKALLSCASPEVFDQAIKLSGVRLPNVVESAEEALSGRPLRGLDLTSFQCPTCTAVWFRVAVVVCDHSFAGRFSQGESLERIPLARYLGTAAQAARLHRAALLARREVDAARAG